jgi:hypothetical protein
MPSFVRWRYLSYQYNNIAALSIQTDTLIVAPAHDRIDDALLQWALSHRRKGFSVGLMIMADEGNNVGTSTFYGFDYVLRNYYFAQLNGHDNDHDYYLRGLGNLTCGTGPPWAPNPAKKNFQPGELPWLGIHWLFMQGLPKNLDSHHLIGSHWPSSLRTTPCTWAGSLRADRQEMIDVIKARIPACDIHVEANFDGSLSAYRYGHERLAGAVFGLNPSGNNAECLRLPEILDQGCIPVMRPAPFLQKTFAPMPGVIADTWSQAADVMIDLIANKTSLDSLQHRLVIWYHQLHNCIKGDLKLILHQALNFSVES